MSSRKRSPKMTDETPSSRSSPSAPAISRSYTSFGHGEGMATFHARSPRAAVCSSRSDSRTPCIETRPNAAVTVVRVPTTSPSPACRTSWSARAESLPLLHETTAFRRGAMTLQDYHGGAADGARACSPRAPAAAHHTNALAPSSRRSASHERAEPRDGAAHDEAVDLFGPLVRIEGLGV